MLFRSSDLLILSLEMLKYEEILRITSIDYAEITNDQHRAVYRNHNSLVIDYDNIVDGLKTGYTKRAGFCLAATSNKENYRLISIVLGVQSRIARNEIVAGMLNNYYLTLGCGPMSPKFSQPDANPQVTTEGGLAQTLPSDVISKTVWAKQRK